MGVIEDCLVHLIEALGVIGLICCGTKIFALGLFACQHSDRQLHRVHTFARSLRNGGARYDGTFGLGGDGGPPEGVGGFGWAGGAGGAGGLAGGAAGAHGWT